jgi:hypothetical protein
MVINLKPVNIIGFSIVQPVGLNAPNQPDDIFTIKTLLNGIAPDDGGADGTLDVSDLSNSPAAMEPLITAIILFQRTQPGLIRDGRVDPERNSIKRMRSLFNRRRGGSVDLNVSITPDGPIFGPCDARGFSAARLGLAGEDWSRFDAFAPVRQMVPVGGTRKLRVKGANGTTVGFALNSPSIPKASIVAQTDDTVTVAGHLDGETDLIVTIEGQRPVPIRLVVRRSATVAIDMVHLGQAPLAQGLMIGTQREITGTVSRIFENQANLTFTPGTTRIVASVRSEGRDVAIDPNRPLIIRDGFGPPSAAQDIRFDDLKTLVTNRAAVTMVISAQLIDGENPAVLGRGETNGRILWFNPMKSGFNTAIIPAHEIGHSLGLGHITTRNNAGFLMNPEVQPNNFIIPCETLVQLRP